ncbi:MAG: hypothetical protein ACXWJZ_01940 [Burkholderiaceae bacterium]
MSLMNNAVIQIIDEKLNGLYRVVSCPTGENIVFLFSLKTKNDTTFSESDDDESIPSAIKRKLITVDWETLKSLDNDHAIIYMEIEPESKLLLGEGDLTEKEKLVFENRRKLAGEFLNSDKVSEALLSKRGIGKLITEIRATESASRSTMYRLWELLCIHGFDAKSLNPRFDRCGAPGVLRPCSEAKQKAGRKTNKERLGIPESNPQVGVSDEIRKKIVTVYKQVSGPKKKFNTIFSKIRTLAFTTTYKRTSEGNIPITPQQGTYPNKSQVRRVIASELGRLGVKRAKTTPGHFDRNYRGLTGRSWEGVAGPGHEYAIDSTIGDNHLRSSVNRAWSVGRPIVYIAVDIWSTAVVGFYACLSGPSWDTAKLALFSSSVAPEFYAGLWGFTPTRPLLPHPTTPHSYLSDRGEYLSAAARETIKSLGFNSRFNASYRPDLKGLVEVLNRITKDEQYQFIPGAIDARRREIELRSNPRDGEFTLREYVAYLALVFEKYNFHADRSYRMTMEMISAGIPATPAGLWSFGHDVGIGYRMSHPTSKLITSYFPSDVASVRRDGVYFDGLLYNSPVVIEKNWTGDARNFGASERQMFYFPGNDANIWWNDPEHAGLANFEISPNALALPGTSFDEWHDVHAYQQLKKRDQAYAKDVAMDEYVAKTEFMVAQASEKTALADQLNLDPIPSTREARSQENNSQINNKIPDPTPTKHTEKNEAYSQEYATLMDELFSTNDSGESQ